MLIACKGKPSTAVLSPRAPFMHISAGETEGGRSAGSHVTSGYAQGCLDTLMGKESLLPSEPLGKNLPGWPGGWCQYPGGGRQKKRKNKAQNPRGLGNRAQTSVGSRSEGEPSLLTASLPWDGDRFIHSHEKEAPGMMAAPPA